MAYGIIFDSKSQGDIVTINGLFRNDGANPAFLVVLDPAAAVDKIVRLALILIWGSASKW
jgi:hypothetical protein